MRLILTMLLSLLALPTYAACVGENLLEGLSTADRAALDASVAAQPYPSGNLWHAKKGTSTIHVMGTLHLSDPRLDAYLKPIWPIVAAADLIFAEATLETTQKLQSEITRNPSLMFITDGPTLPERLPEADWKALSAAMTTRGIPGFFAAKMKPWYAAMMLAIPPAPWPRWPPKTGLMPESLPMPTRTIFPPARLNPTTPYSNCSTQKQRPKSLI